MRSVVIIVLALLCGVAGAAPTISDPLDDRASAIAATDASLVRGDLAELHTAGVDLAVILVRTTGADSIETFARQAATAWQSGATAAGVLVFAIDDRHSRFEIDDTLRLKFTDAQAATTLDNVRGFLRDGNYAGAVRASIRDVGDAWRGGVDVESVDGAPARPAATTTPPPRSFRAFPAQQVGLAILGIGVLFGAGAVWAASTRARSGSFASGSLPPRPSFFVDMLIHTGKVIGILAVFAVAVALSGKSSSSSRSWGSSSGGSSGGGGGGWSGGGASSGW